MKTLKYFLPLFLIVVGLLFASFYSQFSGTDKNAKEERYVVGQNISQEEVFADLAEKKFIKNKNYFNFFFNFFCSLKKTCPKQGTKILPGAYYISKSMSVYKLANTFLFGPYQKWVVIPPGKRKEQIALILQKALGWPFSLARSFSNIAEEGYLYSDTYLIDTDADPQQIIQKLMSNFNEKFDADLQKQLLVQNIRNDTAIKIASLIERESGGSEDKPVISAIIWNRLDKKMKLEIDATVQYAIASEKLDDAGLQSLENFTFWQSLGPGVVKTVNSPYNTYLNEGLPPGPICSPSVESIRAVANPGETDALYYLHSPDKKIHTAKTYKEHQENIEKYLQ